MEELNKEYTVSVEELDIELTVNKDILWFRDKDLEYRYSNNDPLRSLCKLFCIYFKEQTDAFSRYVDTKEQKYYHGYKRAGSISSFLTEQINSVKKVMNG